MVRTHLNNPADSVSRTAGDLGYLTFDSFKRGAFSGTEWWSSTKQSLVQQLQLGTEKVEGSEIVTQIT